MMTEPPPDIFLSVVIPVYRAERSLPELCRRLRSVTEQLDRPCEVVLVDDRSPDNSWDVMRRAAEVDASIVAVRLSRNFGQHYAITAGLDLARGEWAVTMDCDLQDRPEDIPLLLATAERGYDVVLARRKARHHHLPKRVTSWLFYKLFNLISGYRMDPSVGTFRIMRRPVVVGYRRMREATRLFGGMIEWLGFETAYVDVEHGIRYEGESSYNFRSLMRLALDGLIAFSNRPLYLSISLGILIPILSAVFGAMVISRYFFGPPIGAPGWLTTVTLIAFIGGLILMNLGIVGVYIGRIYDETKSIGSAKRLFREALVPSGASSAWPEGSAEAYLLQGRVSEGSGPSLQLESRRKRTPRDRHPRRRRS